MKKSTFVVLTLTFTLSTILTGTAFAAKSDITWRGSGGWGAGLPYQQLFIPSRVEKISGNIVSVERFGEEFGMADGVLLKLRNRRITETIHVGPLWFLERQDLALNIGDTVTVRGARVDRKKANHLIASSINKGRNTLLLRNSEGFPLWTGWRRD